MLVRFSVENYLSFKDKTEFNMLTGSPRRLPHHVYHHGDLELLKMAAIYGANGAGKSNLIEAINSLRNLVCLDEIKSINNTKKFKLNSQNNKKPIIFEIEFITYDTMFFYSIKISDFIIVEEKLYITRDNRSEELVFQRIFSKDKLTIDFNEKYKKMEQDKLRIKLYEEELLKNDETLLAKISGARDGFDIVKQAFRWFSQINSIKPHSYISDLMILNNNIFNFINSYIKKFTTGIDGFNIVTKSFDTFFGENSQHIKDSLIEKLNYISFVDLSSHMNSPNPKSKTIATIENGNYVIKSLFTYHFNEKKDEIAFHPMEESDGSVRLWDLLTAIYFAIHEEGIMIIDEIESSIHPYLLKELITKFSENTETKGQLIFTTHESNLLDQEIFRQDEIWFAEKNTEGATELFPMSDFNVRYDLDIRKGYLNGRFGAIPFLSNFKDLNWKAHVE